MRAVLSCLLLVCLIAFLDCQQYGFRCDYKYIDEIFAFLKYNEMPSNWHEARLRCHMEGSILATPLTDSWKKHMLNIAVPNNVGGIFTGIHSKFSRGDFFSVEGVPLGKIPHSWTKGEPNNHDDKEGCIVMLLDGSFADVSCSETMPYICLKRAVPGMVINECGTTDNSYKMEPKTGHCYKFHRYPRTWSRSYMHCAAEGGYLAIINSEVESQVIRDIYAKNALLEGVGDYVREVAHIGFNDWGEHGEWLTVHGETLHQAGFEKFQPGEPNNASAQFCGGVYRTGLMDDVWCDRRAQFICEMEPKALQTCLYTP